MKMVDDFMVALSCLPTCDASGNYPIRRPTDLDAYILTERAYKLAKAHNHPEPLGFVWRVQKDSNI